MAYWNSSHYYEKLCGPHMYKIRYSTNDFVNNGPPTYVLDDSFMCKFTANGDFHIGEFTEVRTQKGVQLTPFPKNCVKMSFKEFCLFGQYIVSGLAKEMVERSAYALTSKSHEKLKDCVHRFTSSHKIGTNGLSACIMLKSDGDGVVILRRLDRNGVWLPDRARLSTYRVNALYSLFTNFNTQEDLLNVVARYGNFIPYPSVYNDFLTATRASVGVTMAAELYGRMPNTTFLSEYTKEQMKNETRPKEIGNILSSTLSYHIVLAHMLGNELLHEGLVPMDMVITVAKAVDLVADHSYTHAIICRLGEMAKISLCRDPKAKRKLDLVLEPFIRDGEIYEEFGRMCTSSYNINKLHNRCCILRPHELALRYACIMDDVYVNERMDID